MASNLNYWVRFLKGFIIYYIELISEHLKFRPPIYNHIHSSPEHYKREILQGYGYHHLITLDRLDRADLLRSQV